MSKGIRASVKAVLAMVAFAVITALGMRTAFAQAMGEYGMATGHAAANASQMPAIQAEPPSLAPSDSDRDGSTHTEEIRGYEEPEPANDRQGRGGESNDSNDSSQDWVQVK
jgi:hypothetical protein